MYSQLAEFINSIYVTTTVVSILVPHHYVYIDFITRHISQHSILCICIYSVYLCYTKWQQLVLLIHIAFVWVIWERVGQSLMFINYELLIKYTNQIFIIFNFLQWHSIPSSIEKWFQFLNKNTFACQV